MQIEVAVVAPILRAVVALTNPAEVADENRADAAFGALFHDLFRERMEDVRPAVGALPVQASGLVGKRIVTLRTLFGEVVFVFLEQTTGIQQRSVARRHGGDVADPEVHAGRAVPGRFSDFDWDFAHDMEPPDTVFVDGTNLLDILDGSPTWADDVVLSKNEVAPTVFEIFALREPDA